MLKLKFSSAIPSAVRADAALGRRAGAVAASSPQFAPQAAQVFVGLPASGRQLIQVGAKLAHLEAEVLHLTLKP